MPTPARRETSAIDTSASGSVNAARAAARILSRLRSASARLEGDRTWFAAVRFIPDQPYPPVQPGLLAIITSVSPGQSQKMPSAERFAGSCCLCRRYRVPAETALADTVTDRD